MTTFNTAAEQLEALRAPFPVEEIRQREQGGQTLNYFESSTIMKRLVDVMGCGYSISTGRIERYEVDHKPRRVDMEVVVSLTWIDNTTSTLTGWGSADIQYSKSDDWRIVSDFMKVANTDGTKVALSKIGVGSDLYDSTYRTKLVADKAESEKVAREKAMFTCQDCQGQIVAGVIGTKTVTPVEVVTHTRLKFKKRLCLTCAKSQAVGSN